MNDGEQDPHGQEEGEEEAEEEAESEVYDDNYCEEVDRDVVAEGEGEYPGANEENE